MCSEWIVQLIDERHLRNTLHHPISRIVIGINKIGVTGKYRNSSMSYIDQNHPQGLTYLCFSWKLSEYLQLPNCNLSTKPQTIGMPQLATSHLAVERRKALLKKEAFFLVRTVWPSTKVCMVNHAIKGILADKQHAIGLVWTIFTVD